MTNGVSGNQTSINLQRLGVNNQNRVVYKITTNDMKNGYKFSIAPQDMVKFEESFATTQKYAGSVAEYGRKMSTEEGQKRQKYKTIGIIAGTTAVLTGVTGYFTHKKNLSTLKTCFALLGATIVGLVGGTYAAIKASIPKGLKEFMQASKNISEIEALPEK